LVAFAVGAVSLLVPDSALAVKYLFRVERQFFGSPQPPATSPGGAGRYNNYIEPYVSTDGMGNYNFPPAVADVVGYANPIGGTFTLPRGFISYLGNFTFYASTAFPGYTSISGLDYTNSPGYFGPSNPNAATTTTRIVFPTTGGNPYYPNKGVGQPTTMAATPTFAGRYDFDRAGSINVTPGGNRFGGTMKLFYRSGAFWYQYIFYYSPAFYKAYGSFLCQEPPGVTCTSAARSGTNRLTTQGNYPGAITSSGMVTRFLLNRPGTGTGKQTKYNTAKATTPLGSGGGATPTKYGNASYLVAKNFYLHIIHPFTTGFAVAENPNSPYKSVRPQLQGYDKNWGGANLTVTHIYTSNYFNSTLNTISYFTSAYKQYLKGVTRAVSMVRPRLKHVYQKPVNPANPIVQNYASAQAWTMKVFFLPEPTGMLLLGTGIAALLGLSRMRRR
jgi:hypothetical protein